MSKSKKVDAKPIGGYHGITVELPTVQMNIDYEEGKIELSRGYSRMLPHPIVKKLENDVAERYSAEDAIAFTSPESGLFVIMDALFKAGSNGFHFDSPVFAPFFKMLTDTGGAIVPSTDFESAEVAFYELPAKLRPRAETDKLRIGFDLRNSLKPQDFSKYFHAIITGYPNEAAGFILFYDNQLAEQIRGLRRHTGYNLNSRNAERMLEQRKPTHPASADSVKNKIARLEKTDPSLTLLYPTGMAAISNAILATYSPKRSKMVMIGSPYTDTRSLLEKWPDRRGTPPAVFLEVDDLDGAKQAIDEQTALVICEIPTNPLLRVPDLERIVMLAHRKGAKVLVDNTIATPFNLNPFDYDVDFIAHSTTKFLNGMNDHIGGVLLAKDPTIVERIHQFYALLNLRMDADDAATLDAHLDGFQRRMEIINQNAMKLAAYLDAHPLVKQVYYPGLKSHPDHSVAKSYFKGHSGLMSFVLQGDVKQNTARFYDNLGDPILKGPSLGSERSLICLYTILAHYDDPPEKLARMGLNLYLLRISVGIEPIDEIIRAFEAAFDRI